MAGLALLDGSNVALDLAINLSGTVQTSVKCWANYLSADFSRQMIDKTTLCTSGWTDGFPSLKSMSGRIEGFASKGTPMSDPLAWFTQQTAAAITFTADTSCTITCNAFCTADHTGFRAAANSERSVSFVNSGAVTSAWVIA